MKKRTVRVLVSAGAGALTGAVLVFLILVFVGTRGPAPDDSPSSTAASSTGSPSPTVAPQEATDTRTPSATPAVGSPSPATSPGISTRGRHVTNADAGYRFTLPTGYRVAARITEMDHAQVPAAVSLTITKGSETDEEQYVALIARLQRDQVATEAPVFQPGNTITLQRVTEPSAEKGDAQLARARETVRTAGGLSGTRYRRVEGLFTYDATYLRLPSGPVVTVQMSYASQEPTFDETAYTAVLDSLTPL